jgi:hypothetical protein
MQGLINHQLDLSIIILWVGLAFLTACTTLMFHHFLKPGMIFNWYAIFLESFESTYKRYKRYNKILWYRPDYKMTAAKVVLIDFIQNFIIAVCFIFSYLSKPLGLCPYCNGTWIGIVVYIYFFGLTLPVILFLGINWFFIHIIYTKQHE